MEWTGAASSRRATAGDYSSAVWFVDVWGRDELEVEVDRAVMAIRACVQARAEARIPLPEPPVQREMAAHLHNRELTVEEWHALGVSKAGVDAVFKARRLLNTSATFTTQSFTTATDSSLSRHLIHSSDRS